MKTTKRFPSTVIFAASPALSRLLYVLGVIVVDRQVLLQTESVLETIFHVMTNPS